MGIKRYIADKDNTITNAFEQNLSTRGTASNMGASDVLEIFSIYGQAFNSSSADGLNQTQELSRILVQFPITDISTDRTNSEIPISGNVSFYLKLYNAKHASTVPKSMTLTVVPVSSSWQEGFGLDMENYQDLTKGNEGSNWMMRSASTAWATVGGTYLTASTNNDYGDLRVTASFEKGTENLELDITDTVERWIKGTVAAGGFPNYGLGIHLSASQEAYYSSSVGGFANGSIIQNVSGATRSYYTKKFFARTSEFFFKRPLIEARWDSTKQDDRGNLFYSSSLASAANNLNTIYLYNYINGRLQNIPGLTDASSKIYVQIFSGSSNNTVPSGLAMRLVTTTDFVDTAVPTVVTGGYVSTGIYSASFALTADATPLTKIFDVWYLDGTNQLGAQINTGSINPNTLKASNQNVPSSYVANILNLKPSYDTSEETRLRVVTRLKDWKPTIYSRATAKVENTIINDMYYKIIRIFDDSDIIPYGTGSTTPQAVGTAGSYTRLSYDVSGSYFDLDMSLLEPGYMYGLKLAYYHEPGYKEFNRVFNFRVDKNQDS